MQRCTTPDRFRVTRINGTPTVAMCDCNWLGDIRQSSEEAFHDAYGHTANVDEELKRPVG